MKEAKEASRPLPRKTPITRRRMSSGWESWRRFISPRSFAQEPLGIGSSIPRPPPKSSRTHLHGTLHLAQPHRLKKLQAMPNDDCQIQCDFAAGRRIGGKIVEQRLPRQSDHFRLKQRRGGGE